MRSSGKRPENSRLITRFPNLEDLKVKDCSLFAVYDGHGGDACSNKLKEVFHRFILKDF